MLEQTAIAKMLGLSNSALKRICIAAKLDNENYYKLIDNKRHYNISDIVAAIQLGNKIEFEPAPEPKKRARGKKKGSLAQVVYSQGVK